MIVRWYKPLSTGEQRALVKRDNTLTIEIVKQARTTRNLAGIDASNSAGAQHNTVGDRER